MDNKTWICKICGRKICWFWRVIRCWYHSDEYGGKVHCWCYNKPKDRNRSLNFTFA
ncbi:MAG: hypothetical protein WC475_03040 [Candidatus Paceibacterota bacterium]